MRRRWIALTALWLCGFGPFMCDDPKVNEANERLKAGRPDESLTALAEVEDDAPAVHLARGLAQMANQQLEDATTSFDQAWRLVAEALTVGEGKKPAPEMLDLRRRVAFARGLLAIEKALALEKEGKASRGDPGEALGDWTQAHRMFSEVLALDPEDEAARWNLELAWFRLHPPCPLREDDHEPDDTRADAKPPPEPQQGEGGGEPQKDRLLCPANEDWYVIDVPGGSWLFVTIEGEIDTSEGESRQVTLDLFGPNDDKPVRSTAMTKGKATVGVTGVRTDGQWAFRVGGPGRAEMKYLVKVEIVPPCPADDALEENDTPDAAAVVDQQSQGQPLKACPGDADWYLIDQPADEDFQVSIAFDPERAPLTLKLFDATATEEIAEVRQGPTGAGARLEKVEEARKLLARVTADEGVENTYQLQAGPPNNNGGQNNQDQDQQDQDENEDEKQDQDQDKQDQNQGQDPQDQKNQPQDANSEGQDQPDQIDVQKLIEAIDEHDKNPQLEKVLRNLRTVPRMEDY